MFSLSDDDYYLRSSVIQSDSFDWEKKVPSKTPDIYIDYNHHVFACFVFLSILFHQEGRDIVVIFIYQLFVIFFLFLFPSCLP